MVGVSHTAQLSSCWGSPNGINAAKRILSTCQQNCGYFCPVLLLTCIRQVQFECHWQACQTTRTFEVTRQHIAEDEWEILISRLLDNCPGRTSFRHIEVQRSSRLPSLHIRSHLGRAATVSNLGASNSSRRSARHELDQPRLVEFRVRSLTSQRNSNVPNLRRRSTLGKSWASRSNEYLYSGGVSSSFRFTRKGQLAHGTRRYQENQDPSTGTASLEQKDSRTLASR